MKFRKTLIIGSLVLFTACAGEDGSGSSSDNAKGTTVKGEQLFNNYCLQCHGLKEDKIGPKLKGAFSHWDNDTARIAAFIRNSEEAIASGDPRAVQVADEWNHAMMTPMPQLSDEDIHALLEYMQQ